MIWALQFIALAACKVFSLLLMDAAKECQLVLLVVSLGPSAASIEDRRASFTASSVGNAFATSGWSRTKFVPDR